LGAEIFDDKDEMMKCFISLFVCTVGHEIFILSARLWGFHGKKMPLYLILAFGLL